MEDKSFYWVITEGADGKQIGARVSPVDDPIYGEFYEGQPEPAQWDPGLIRANEGPPLERT